MILAKNIPINGQTSIDHFFADQFRSITTSGTITEFLITFANDSNPGGIAAQPNGAIWFGAQTANKIGVYQ